MVYSLLSSSLSASLIGLAFAWRKTSWYWFGMLLGIDPPAVSFLISSPALSNLEIGCRRILPSGAVTFVQGASVPDICLRACSTSFCLNFAGSSITTVFNFPLAVLVLQTRDF